jgi:hypothetical protein
MAASLAASMQNKFQHFASLKHTASGKHHPQHVTPRPIAIYRSRRYDCYYHLKK